MKKKLAMDSNGPRRDLLFDMKIDHRNLTDNERTLKRKNSRFKNQEFSHRQT